VSGVRIAAVGLLTGWGEGVAALPADARRAAAGRALIPLATPHLDGERFRRATRECVLAVAAVEALRRDGAVERATLAGPDTALVYVTASAYGASNRAFVEGGGTGSPLHFPYTAPSAVPGEVAIEYQVHGAYVILLGGAAAALDALWQAARLVARGTCARALVLAVETFDACADLYGRGRWLVGAPLVETAVCALLAPGDASVSYGPPGTPSPLEDLVRTRAGETLAAGPLIALALARDCHYDAMRLSGRWRDRRVALEWQRDVAPLAG
jgi:hypothetical protein